jgi:transcriptional regulator with XRE-family HTH domain
MDTDQRKQLAERIIAARKERGWSQNRLAQEADVSPNTVLSIEQAKRVPQEGKLRAILNALGIEPLAANATLDLSDVPADAQMFVRVALQRLKVMDEPTRNRVLADLYPRLLL